MSVNLGRVAYVEKGEYKSDTTYESKDVVSFNGGSYVYIGDTPTANVSPTDEAHWQPLIDPTAMNEKIAEMDGVKQEALAAAATASEKAQEATAAAEAADNAAQAATEAAEAADTAAEAADEARLAIADELNKKAPVIPVDASGDIVTITDGADGMPVASLITHVVPVQEGSGEPSPDNVRAISGWESVKATRTGKNLVDISETITFTQGLTHYCNIPAGNYIVSCENVSATGAKKPALEFADKNRGTIAVIDNLTGGTAKTVNLDRDAGRIVFYANGYSFANSAGINATIEGFMVSKVGGAYEPYNGQTLTAELPETVYGGTLNWTTGVLTVTHALQTFDGSEAWVASDTNTAGIKRYFASLKKPSKKSDSNDIPVAACNVYQISSSNHVYQRNQGVAISSRGDQIVDFDDAHQTGDVSSFKAHLAELAAAGTPMTLVYPLATPYTIPLTPQQVDTLKGTNNIWSNAGETTVTYAADTKMYIDQKIAAIAAAIVNE